MDCITILKGTSVKSKIVKTTEIPSEAAIGIPMNNRIKNNINRKIDNFIHPLN